MLKRVINIYFQYSKKHDIKFFKAKYIPKGAKLYCFQNGYKSLSKYTLNLFDCKLFKNYINEFIALY